MIALASAFSMWARSWKVRRLSAGPADLAGVVEHRREVEPAAAGLGDHLAGDGALDRGEAAFGAVPAVLGVVEQLQSFHLFIPVMLNLFQHPVR